MTERLDCALTARGFCATRSKAQAIISEGFVCVNGTVCMKASRKVSDSDSITVTGSLPFVGRGGYKLRYALAEFGISVTGLHCLDIGASTGGFTDCLLQNGAAFVLAADVGHGQLAEELRNDPRVKSMEGTDIRALSPTTEGLPADFAVCDVSFISLTQVLPSIPPLLKPDGTAVVLVKPQFEAGRAAIGKNGIVRDPKVHRQVLQAVRSAASLAGFSICAECESPIKGGSGNTEFLLHLALGMLNNSKEVPV